ncbi:hypothetical protein ZWY2020_025363 [Hordeum vulgare]|nr:hypothetical protein ZWY2020_025363 [Hordeum vulgare]
MLTSKISKEMKNEDMYFHDLDFDFYNPDTNVDEDFHGKEGDLPLYCVLHETKPLRCVAFEGSETGRRIYGCAVKDIEQLNLNLKNLERQKKQLDIDHKDLKSIHACLMGIVRNIEEERDETKLDGDFLEQE